LNPNHNVQKILAERCNEGLRITFVMRRGDRTRVDATSEGKKIKHVDTERGVNQYQVQFKTFFNLYLNHSTISNEK
jgi:hypothetical protein